MENSPLPAGPAKGKVLPLEEAEALRTRFFRYRYIFLRYWWIVVACAALGVLFQGWKALTRPITYQSSGKIIVSGRLALPEGSLYSEEAINFFGTQTTLMESGEVARRAATRVQELRPDLAPSPVQINVSQIPRTSIFVLSASGSQPDYVKAYLDAVMESYITLRRSMVSEKSQSTLAAITDQIMRLETELRNGEDALLEWQKQNNLAFLQEEGNSAADYLASLNRELARLESRYQLLDQLSPDQAVEHGQLSAEETRSTDPLVREAAGSESAAELGSGPLVDYQHARRKLLLLQAELQQLQRDLLENHPKVQDLKRRISEQEALLDILRKQSREQIQIRRDAVGIQIADKKKQIAEWEKKALDLSRRQGEFERLKGKVDRQKVLYDRLIANVQNVDVNTNIQQDIVSVMEYASQPGMRVASVAREVSLGLIFGLLAGAGILFLIGLLDDRIVSISELQTVFAEEVVGIIPRVASGEPAILRQNDERQALREAYRNIRSWFLFTPWKDAPPKSILVASAVPQEGKTTISINLASTLAASGARVLLVDGDIRRGNVHKYFSRDSEPGLGDLLAGRASVDECIETTEYDSLEFIPRGHMENDAQDVIFGKGVQYLLDTVRDRYDYVIFDSSPLMAVDDTSSLAPRMDVVLLVVRAGFSSIRLTRKTLDVLGSRHANVEGLIYNNVDWDSMDYAYHKYEYGQDKTETPAK